MRKAASLHETQGSPRSVVPWAPELGTGMPKPHAQICHWSPGKLRLCSLVLAPGEGAYGHSLPASPQAPPLLNSSVPGRPEPVTPINRGCMQQEGAWAASALKPGETSGSCQLEVGEVREVGRFLPGLPESWPGPGCGLLEHGPHSPRAAEARQSPGLQSSLLYGGDSAASRCLKSLHQYVAEPRV